MWNNFDKYKGITPLDEFVRLLPSLILDEKQRKTRKKIAYWDIPAAFDIETTSFYNGDQKSAVMYEWTFGLNGCVTIGRTWQQFVQLMGVVSSALKLAEDSRLCVYVHNLAFEFQFIRHYFEWINVFAVKERKPIYAVTSTGIEFRCSLILSGYSLETVGKHLSRYPVQKLIGELDYTLHRNCKTELTAQELAYCENDVRVVMSYIQECIEQSGNITKIPLTKTGYVRRYCRDACLKEEKKNGKKDIGKWRAYRRLMDSLTIEPDEYRQMQRAFQGGFTHCSAFHQGEKCEGVESFDFTSAYPYVMVSEQFPMSKGKKVEINTVSDAEEYMKYYFCIFDVEFHNLDCLTFVETPISKSRCRNVVDPCENNGRIFSCSYLDTTMTDIDFDIVKHFYRWEGVRFRNFRIYKRAFLPTDLVRSILKLYEDKTKLKGVDGMEEEYMYSKEMLNSIYGMMVTNIVRYENKYKNDEWCIEFPDIAEALKKTNESKNRFSFFAWGLAVTAYCRRNLFTAILECGDDYIYSDTDSVKIKNPEKHELYFANYNEQVRRKLGRASRWHGIPFESFAPFTIDGKQKMLGVWDDEGRYTYFKSLGAKRYMTEKDGKLSLTVSGVNKKDAIPYLQKKYKDPFAAFTDELIIPADYTGKLTHTYIDESISGELTDYQGHTEHYNELSCVHLEKAEYNLSISELYRQFLKGVRLINE